MACASTCQTCSKGEKQTNRKLQEVIYDLGYHMRNPRARGTGMLKNEHAASVHFLSASHPKLDARTIQHCRQLGAIPCRRSHQLLHYTAHTHLSSLAPEPKPTPM